jgi:hypothetical protein
MSYEPLPDFRLPTERLRHEGGGCPRRPRLPWGRPHSTLRRCAGSRPGSGWDRVGPARSRPRAPPTLPAEESGSLAAPVPRGALPPGDLRCDVPARSCPLARAPCAAAYSSNWLPSRVAWGAGQTQGEPLTLARAAPRSGPDPGRKRMQDLRPRPLGRLGSSRLPAVHLPPINPVICRGSYLVMSGDARLGEGFPLRCFQRFARPHVATQRCRSRDNWHTSGASTPVLSY